MKYLRAMPKPIPNIDSINTSLFIVKKSPPLIADNNKNIISNSSKNNNKDIFTSDYEFIKIMKNLEEQIRILITDHGKKLDLIIKYEEIFENRVKPEEKEIEERIIHNIEIRGKELAVIKKIHFKLLQKYNTLYKMITTEDLFRKKAPLKKKDDEIKSSF